MTVSELIEELKKYPGDKKVFVPVPDGWRPEYNEADLPVIDINEDESGRSKGIYIVSN